MRFTAKRFHYLKSNDSMPVANITVRQAYAADVDTIVSLGHKTFVETYGDNNKKEAVAAYVDQMFNHERIEKEVNTFGERFFIAYVGELPVGFTKLSENRVPKGLNGKKKIQVERIYVLKEYQGFKIGTELIEKVLLVAKEEEYKIAWLSVWQKNNKAIQFYQKAGFVIYDTDTFQFGEEVHDDFLMKKEIW
ncbi:MAG: GNAT family N-acetyltransferase [Sphingobacteriales bacterium]|nr:GNAT family N-acetyltransferase [Sphingobacteriales bacterium]